MLSSVLRSPRAVQVNIEIMRAFVAGRRPARSAPRRRVLRERPPRVDGDDPFHATVEEAAANAQIAIM